MLADRVEQLLDRFDVLERRSFHCKLAVLNGFHEALTVVARHGTMLRQVALGADQDDEDLVLCLVLQVLGPLGQLVV